MNPELYEKLGAFYLGRPHDPAGGETADGPLLYDSADLVTHAVCIGMTGSGKTGLCIDLIEEAALDGIPALLIDPKGDLGNLLLTFPDLEPADFRPWVNEDDARRKGVSPEEYAVQQAALWREGLAEWGQDGERIRRLREAVDMRIYTPGSEAGLPVSILASLAAPAPEVVEDGDLFADRVGVAATSLLSLLGVQADPIRSREHLLLSTLFDHEWRAGRDLDLAGLIRGIQDPPVRRLGVMEVESFYPARERFELATRLNNLLAAPSFAAWLAGTPLEIDRLLYTAEGKPRLAIFSIAHLSDAERMFFVSLLLNQTLGWVRTRSGTTSLRAMLYMDEVFGYLPPVAEPPSKKPLLTLMKQGRAFGFGVVLATQNPVDLDYKALSNAGTWFLGRLQTERDKARVLDGLEGVAASREGFDRGEMDRTLSGLDKRVFLLHNVHDEAPTIFRTRWAMSYLRGPLTRSQIARLMDPVRGEAEVPEAPPEGRLGMARAERPVGGGEGPVAPGRRETAGRAGGGPRPVLPAGIRQLFLPAEGESPALYRPRVLGLARVRYVKRGLDVEHQERLGLLAPFDAAGAAPDWESAERSTPSPDELPDEPEAAEASYADLPPAATREASYSRWEKDLANWLYDNCRHVLLRSPSLEELSRPGEEERDFRIRLGQLARQERDRRAAELRAEFQEDMDRLQQKIRTARDRLAREEEQVKNARLSTMVSAGMAVLSGLAGRSRLGYRTMSRAGSAVRGVGRIGQQREDVQQVEAKLRALLEEETELRERLEDALEGLAEKIDPLTEELEEVQLAPRRQDVDVRLVALAWVPE